VKRTAILVLIAACGGKYQAPPPVASIALPDGSQLKPYHADQPGKARPQGLAQAAGRVYVTLSNQRDTATFPVNAGPGFLAAFVPSTNSITLIDLGGSDGLQCQNPGFVRASADGRLYAPCSGNFSGIDVSRAIVEVDPLANIVTRRAAIPDGRVPNGVAVTPTRIWTGDSFTTTVFSIDRTTLAADPTAPVPLDCPKTKFSYVADVMTIGGDVYALCASDTSGVLYRLAPDTGAVKATVAVGPNPTELTGLDDGRIVVVSAGDNTLWLVTPSGTTLSARNVLTLTNAAALQDVRAFGRMLFTVASATNTAQRIDLDAQGGPKVVGEANFGEGAGPYNILPLDDTQAIVSNRGTNTIAAANWITAK
jgi:sugar lactone lactonase YvrE